MKYKSPVEIAILREGIKAQRQLVFGKGQLYMPVEINHIEPHVEKIVKYQFESRKQLSKKGSYAGYSMEELESSKRGRSHKIPSITEIHQLPAHGAEPREINLRDKKSTKIPQSVKRHQVQSTQKQPNYVIQSSDQSKNTSRNLHDEKALEKEEDPDIVEEEVYSERHESTNGHNSAGDQNPPSIYYPDEANAVERENNFFQKVKRSDTKKQHISNQAPTRIQVKKVNQNQQKLILQHHPDPEEIEKNNIGSSQVVQKFVTVDGKEMNLNFRISDLYALINRHEVEKNRYDAQLKSSSGEKNTLLIPPALKDNNFKFDA